MTELTLLQKARNTVSKLSAVGLLEQEDQNGPVGLFALSSLILFCILFYSIGWRSFRRLAITFHATAHLPHI